MRNALLKSVLPVAALALAAACIILPDVGDDEGWRTAPSSSSSSLEPNEVRQTAGLAPGSTLTVENDCGDVEISGWDRESAEIVARAVEATIERTRSARISGGRAGEPGVEVRETRNGLLVRAPAYEGPGLPPAVAYEIRVPADIVLAGIRIGEGSLRVSDVYGRIEASLERGNLTVINYSGIVEARIGEGDADVEVLDLRETDSITITSGRGDIVLRLEPGVQAIVEADAPRGEVRSDFDLGVKLPVRTAKVWIGQGGPNIILKASDGRIDIRAVR
jgi:bifunctional DNA-binding transcriptional regulator/antitoxin component of YhaV-PrlF toxin-antitoxin module